MWICPHCGADVQADWAVCWNCTRPREGVQPAELPEPAGIPSSPAGRYEQCPRCQSSRGIPYAEVVDTRAPSAVAIYVPMHPNALLLRGGTRSKLRAWVCGSCGYTELYADDPQSLWEIYRRSQENDQSDTDSEDDPQ